MTVAAEPVNVAAMAKRLRRTRRTIYNWQQEGCPIEEGDVAVLAWVAARKEARESESEEAGDLKERKLLAECAKLEAEGEAKRLKNAIAKSEVTNTEAIMQAVRSAFALVKIRFEDLPQRLQMDFPPETREYLTGRLEDETRLILTELFNAELAEPEGEDDQDD